MKLRRGTKKKPCSCRETETERSELTEGLSPLFDLPQVFLAAKTEPLTPSHRVGLLKRIPHSLLRLARKLIEKIRGKLRKGRGREAAAFPKGYGGDFTLYSLSSPPPIPSRPFRSPPPLWRKVLVPRVPLFFPLPPSSSA